MRKIGLSLLSVLLLLTLAACAKGTNQAETSNAGNAAPKAEVQLNIKAVNYNFDQKVYHLKAGVPVELTLDNETGNHGVKIPDLGVKLDQAHPSAVITPDKAGTYEMSCSIPCGPGHKNMKAQIIVE